MKRTLVGAGVAVMALLGLTGCHKPCPRDVSVYYTAGC